MVPLAYGGTSRQDYERVAPKGSFLHVGGEERSLT